MNQVTEEHIKQLINKALDERQHSLCIQCHRRVQQMGYYNFNISIPQNNIANKENINTNGIRKGHNELLSSKSQAGIMTEFDIFSVDLSAIKPVSNMSSPISKQFNKPLKQVSTTYEKVLKFRR